MRNDSKKQSEVLSIRKRIAAMFILWTLLLIAAVPSFIAAEANKAPEGMIYCPLSRKFQPLNPPKESKLFEDICATAETKEFLIHEIFVKNSFRRISFDQYKLEKLAFDFLARGESALQELPNLPKIPSENLTRQIGSSPAVNNTYESQFVWNQPVRYFSPTILARPPTGAISVFYTNNLITQSDELSRRLAPRAPPVRS